MSHIYIYSPSGAVRDRRAFARGVKRLQTLGHQVEVDAAALSRSTRFAGDDDTRLAAIHRAAASGADLALIARGGYGLTRLLDRIHYPSLARAIENGTAFMGLSDFTALQMALWTQTQACTWAGCDLEADWGRGDPDEQDEPNEIMQACVHDVLIGQAEGVGWRLKRSQMHSLPDGWHLHQARLWGGNLSMLCSLLATPHWPGIEQGILFLEDVGEHPYRIERMLDQLMAADVLPRQQAIVLGAFNGFQTAAHDRGFKLSGVVERLRSRLQIPVIEGLPFGHQATKVCLPVGRQVDLVRTGAEVLLLW